VRGLFSKREKKGRGRGPLGSFLFSPWGFGVLGLTLTFWASLSLVSCGYEFSPTPYRLRLPPEGMRLYIPVAENHSLYARLGPSLTRAVIENIAGVKGLSIAGPESEATLRLEILKVVVTTGSWEPPRRERTETPEASSSRTLTADVAAEFTRPGEGEDKAPVLKRRVFSSYRTFAVSQNQDQVDVQEAEALEWIIRDISGKIANLMFTEF
jgi:hypothetical protein